MTTALTVIEGACRLIGILAEGEALTATQSSDALESLNNMVAAWELDGIAIGAPSWALADTINLPANHLDPIKYNLAVRLAPEYEKPVSSIVVQMAGDGYKSLQAVYGEAMDMDIDTAILSFRRRFPSGRPI